MLRMLILIYKRFDMSIRDAARSELTHLSDDIALLRVENDSLKRGVSTST